MTIERQKLGQQGEDYAARKLTALGYAIHERNWRCKQGEIDIIAFENDQLVICEVKTRRSSHFGAPIEAVTPKKIAKLRLLAGIWIQEQSDNGRKLSSLSIRLDVIGIEVPRSGPIEFTHIVGAN